MEQERTAAWLRITALLIFGLGLVLVIRLVLVALPGEQLSVPTPSALPTAEEVRAPVPSSTVTASERATPGVTILPTEPPAGTAETSATPERAFVPTVEPTTAGETITPTLTGSPSVTPMPSLTATVPATVMPAGPTPTVAGRLVNNRIEPPWWPCEPNAIKAESKLGYYYVPDHQRYSAVYVGVTCFSSVAAAQAAGYVPGP